MPCAHPTTLRMAPQYSMVLRACRLLLPPNLPLDFRMQGSSAHGDWWSLKSQGILRRSSEAPCLQNLEQGRSRWPLPSSQSTVYLKLLSALEGQAGKGDVAGWPHPQPTQVSGVRGKDPLSSSRATSLLILNPGRLAETGVNRVGVPAPWGLQPFPAIHH